MTIEYTTYFQYERLRNKIDQIRKQVAEVSKRMGTAAEHGDLLENSEFLYAADERNLQSSRLLELVNEINSLEIIPDDAIDLTRIGIGTSIDVINLVSNKREVFNLVGAGPSDIDNREVPYSSPIGQGLLGLKVGEEVEINVPSEMKKYRVLEIKKYSPKE
jgi:transcription elongation factor GreA